MQALSQERLHAVFRAVADGVVMQDTTGAIVTCNPAAERLLGLTLDQMMGRTSLDPRWRSTRLDGSDLPGQEHPAMVTLATGEPLRDFIMGIALPDGVQRWLHVNTDPVEEDGQRVGVVSTFSDVSPFLEAEARARRNERIVDDIRLIQAGVIGGEASERTWDSFLALVLRASGAKVAILLEVNPDSQMHELRPFAALVRDPISRGTIRLPLPTDIVRPTGVLRDVLRTRLACQGSAEVLAPLGLWPGQHSVTALPLLTGGAVQGVLLLAECPDQSPAELGRSLDVQLVTGGQLLSAARAERNRREAVQLKRLDEERLRLVLEATGIGHWDWNPETDEAVFDEQWCRLIGYAPNEIIGSGKSWVAHLHPDDRGLVLEALIPHLAGSSAEYRTEFRMRHRDGRWIWILAVGHVIERDTTGKATRMVGIHLDVTRERAAAEELATARDVAERANRAKSEFLAAMSHEIRTPMNGVLGVAHLLLGTTLNAEQRGFANTIRQSGEILLTLIDDILDFSKIEAERLEIESVPFDPQVTVAEVADMLVHRAEEKEIAFVVDWDCVPPVRAMGDPKRVRQVLVNLLGNAVKFTEEGSVTLRVQIPAPDLLRFEVIDTGIGIPVEKQALVFERFSQADGSTTRRYGGTGLGLAISRRLVQAMGGTLSLESVPGAGATFRVDLPTALEPNVEASMALDDRDVVLCASGANGTALGHLMERAGARVTHCTSCGDALNVVQRLSRVSGTPHLLLIDPDSVQSTVDLVSVAVSGDAGRLTRPVVLSTFSRYGALSQALRGTPAVLLRKPLARVPAILRVLGEALGTVAPPESALEPVLYAPRRHADPLVPRFEGVQVLLAEDNEVNQLVALTILQKLGCEVVTASDGRQAVDEAARHTFDCIFMDCDMPELDGYEATAAIRAREAALPGTPHVAIIALTANALVGDREKCLAAGMDDYLAKPIIPRDMEGALERWTPGVAAVGAYRTRAESQPST